VHDLSDGGLAVALAEMAIASGIGASVMLPSGPSPLHALFGEDQGRYLLTVRGDDRAELLKAAESAGVTLTAVGMTGGGCLQVDLFMSISVAKLTEAYETWFPAYMKGAV
jgi:phosphoribosylformylglycinamidine synthase